MAKVITARRPDRCRDPKCEAPIAAGEQINYGGPGAVTHEACKAIDAAPRGRSRGRGSRYGYTSGGAGVTESSSRCIDAPCCGCC
jgi:hypothetical protein